MKQILHDIYIATLALILLPFDRVYALGLLGYRTARLVFREFMKMIRFLPTFKPMGWPSIFGTLIFIQIFFPGTFRFTWAIAISDTVYIHAHIVAMVYALRIIFTPYYLYLNFTETSDLESEKETQFEAA